MLTKSKGMKILQMITIRINKFQMHQNGREIAHHPHMAGWYQIRPPFQ